MIRRGRVTAGHRAPSRDPGRAGAGGGFGGLLLPSGAYVVKGGWIRHAAEAESGNLVLRRALRGEARHATSQRDHEAGRAGPPAGGFTAPGGKSGLGPLVADLAPPHLLGRYISVLGLMATGGLAIGPAIGGAVLAASPDAVWWGGGLLAVVIGVGFLLSGGRIPEPLAVEVGVPDVGEEPRAATQATN